MDHNNLVKNCWFIFVKQQWSKLVEKSTCTCTAVSENSPKEKQFKTRVL